MVTTQKRVRKTAIKLTIAAAAFASFGAYVVAAPFALVPRADVAPTQLASLEPLASGPSIQLAKAGAGEKEDCVRVTRMTGPDGQEYPTNGIVCSGK